jgi:hypothetical protein
VYDTPIFFFPFLNVGFFFFFLIEMMGNLVVVLICVWSLILIGLIFFFGHSIMEEV